MSKYAEQIATALHKSNCFRFGLFKIKSGDLSPYYIDLARLLSSPEDLNVIIQVTSEVANQIIKKEKIDKLASIALKGALITPGIAILVDLPCVIIRKSEKKYGATGRIVGAEVNRGDKILFIDDVVSKGISKIEGIKPLEDRGAEIKHMIVIVDREQGGKQKLEEKGYIVNSITTISEIINILLNSKKISKKQAQKVLNYIKKSDSVTNKKV